ncbi:MAG: bifunctional UDP-N-acetylglucosamine diphosphorylase/glucosamine-1-phosphate N-acetyltransferase GlmU, partial [Alphaproteobacteria bacterium]
KAVRSELDSYRGTVLVLYGDSPLIGAETIERMLERAAEPDRPAVVVLGFRPLDPGEYGRLVVGADGMLEAIVEAHEAGPEERAIDLCNSGFVAVDGARLFDLVDRVHNDNAKGEYYLTDIVRLARRDGLACAAVEAPADELMGIDSRADLAVAEILLQTELRARAMAAGATLVDPTTVWLSFDTVLGHDVAIEPNVFIGPGVRVGDGATIKAFSHLEGAIIGPGAVVGPFARLRPGAEIGARAHVGNFVEAKNAVLGEGAKANHLSYVGDADVGPGANIGAGTITCNYDGFAKHRTSIGAGAFIGSNSALVAPVSVGRDAIVAAGSTINRDVADGALALARGQQVEKPGWAARWRARKADKREG